MMKLILTCTRFAVILLMIVAMTNPAMSQDPELLPPTQPWKGKSLELIAGKNNKWITVAEQSNFIKTSTYRETMDWLAGLCQTAPNLLKMISIGKSAQGRDINMVIVSSEATKNTENLRNSRRPLLLIQAGIHSGEIDGKDAGMMLLRDIVSGQKKELVNNVNILFVPILSVDAHERSSPYNRVNQRGPENMGWRTNARNLNLNRDYTKLDSEEIRAIATVINDFEPELYLDLHVTDGADYQYDITYGFSEAYSPAIGAWLRNKLSPVLDKDLREYGHIPGPLMFAANDRDFTEGNIEYAFAPRFSNTYGDLRHLPSILLENHSLKPFKQRVLGTYVFLESIIKILGAEGAALQSAIIKDQAVRNPEVVLSWKKSQPDSMLLLGIESVMLKSEVTGKEHVSWTGKPIQKKIAYIKNNTPDKIVKRPKAYWVPSTYKDVIDRMRNHGIRMEAVTAERTLDVRMYRITDYKFSSEPFEGHFSVTASVKAENRQEKFYPGSVRISTDQPLGDLVVHLLEPESGDSFFQWCFFPEIFNRTEYIEEYAIEPLARNMMARDEKLRVEFETKKKNDPAFASNPQAMYEWFYTRSPYVDQRWLLYPVGIEDQE
jgi:hypothetical protein